MCVSDWRAGRFIRSVVTGSTITDASPFIIAPSRQRVGLRVSAFAEAFLIGNVVNVVSGGVAVGYIGVGAAGFYISLAADGDLPTKGFSIQVQTSGIATIGVTEYFLPEEFLDAGTKEWQRLLMGRNP